MLHIELLQFLEQIITPLMREMVIFYRTTLAILFQGNTREKQTSNNLSNVGSQRIFLWNKIILNYSLSKNHISLIFELRKNKNKSTFRSWATKGNNIEWKNFEFNNFNRVRRSLASLRPGCWAVPQGLISAFLLGWKFEVPVKVRDLIYVTSKQRPLINNGQYWWVPRVAVVWM